MRKIIISPDNKRAIAFFEKLSAKKKEMRERFERIFEERMKNGFYSQLIKQ